MFLNKSDPKPNFQFYLYMESKFEPKYIFSKINRIRTEN